jgi:taurine---2-oxoglutarate transaminase
MDHSRTNALTEHAEEHPFYYSWCAQKAKAPLDIQEVEDFAFYVTKNGTNETRRLLDLSSLSFHASFGLRPQSIMASINQAMMETPILPARGTNKRKMRATKRLLDYLQLPLGGKIFYTVSGAESVENALKMAREISGKRIILAREESYHGASLGALMATGDWRNAPHQTPKDWTARIPSPLLDPEAKECERLIQEIGPEHIAAMILETVPASNGVSFASTKWWKRIRELCTQNNIFLIADEVVCGFHRLGTPLGIHHFDITPDFVCLAKAISGGVLPLGAVWTAPSISAYYDNHVLTCGLTQYAFQAGLGALEGVLDIVTAPHFTESYREREKIFHHFLQRWQTLPYMKTVRFIGMIACLEHQHLFKAQDLEEAGLFCYQKNERLILCPALNYDLTLLREALERLEGVLAKTAAP